jgi:enoyl-CoA hydratase/carnithine racemase
LTDEPIVTRQQRGNISVLTMTYRPYNLLGPKLIDALAEQLRAAQAAGSRAIVIRSALRHFSAGADLEIFASGLGAGNATEPFGAGLRMNPLEFLRFMESLPTR